MAFTKGTALILSLDETKITSHCSLTPKSSTYFSLNFRRTADLFPILFFCLFYHLYLTWALLLHRCDKQLVAENGSVWFSRCVRHYIADKPASAGCCSSSLRAGHCARHRNLSRLAVRHIGVDTQLSACILREIIFAVNI